MKIALTNLCKTEDFAKHKTYENSISFLRENGIEFFDFASGAEKIDDMVKGFNDSLESDADLVWVIRGGNKCIQTLDKLDWNKAVNSGKKFYGLSDFTHFSTMAVAKGLTCYYGQGLTNIKEYFPDPSERKFIADFLISGMPQCGNAQPLVNADRELQMENLRVVGGHLLIFSLMQSQLQIDLNDRFVFFEYHTGALGENLDDLGYYVDQLLFVLKNNMPKGFILGRTEIRNSDESQIKIEAINEYCINKLSNFGIPVYYIDHFKNTITFS